MPEIISSKHDVQAFFDSKRARYTESNVYKCQYPKNHPHSTPKTRATKMHMIAISSYA